MENASVMVGACTLLSCSAWTAVATIALVGVTGVYAWLTWRLARNAARSADAAERAVLLETLPILLPNRGTISDPRGSDGEWAVVRIRNGGRQPGLNVSVSVRVGDKSTGPVTVAQVLPGGTETVTLPQSFHYATVFSTADVVITVEYSDAIANRYRVERVDAESHQDVSLHRSVEGNWKPLLVADRSAQVSFFEFEVPDPPRREE